MSIEKHRRRLDDIDGEVVKLLNERAKHVLEIARIKTAQNSQFYVPGREKKILEEIRAKNEGPLPAAAVDSIYREVLSAMRSLEAPLVIAYFGPEATFTHIAARQMFGTSAEYKPAATIGDVFTEVERDRASYGVVPVENSTEGVVSRTLDTFMESDLKICAEVLMEISHSRQLRARRDKEGLFVLATFRAVPLLDREQPAERGACGGEQYRPSGASGCQ